MLANALTTNEVKDRAGVEVEFSRLSSGPGRTTEFAKVGEAPNLEYRLRISHQEVGSGTAQRRRSMVRFDKDIVGTSGETRTVSAYMVVDIPTGDMSAITEAENVIANILSFCGTTGAATTVLFDATGNGAVVLKNGDL